MISRMGVVSALTMVSRVFGLFRDMFITAVFGASLLNSAFTAAFTLPSLFRRLLGEGALTAALMPNLSEEMEENGREAVFRLVNKTLSWLLVICVLITGLAYGVLFWIEDSAVLENWIIGAGLAKLVFPYIVPVCLAAVVAAVLNMLGRFAIPAMTAIWLNSCMMLSLGIGTWLWVESEVQKMNFLCLGVLLGGLLQFMVPSLALVREGWRPRLDFSVSPRLRSVLFLTLPGIYGTASHQINVMVSRFLALDFNESGATFIYLANRLVELPLGVFTIAISTVIFPSMAQAIAKGKGVEFGKTYRKGISLSMMLTLPAAVGLSMLAPEIVTVLFERGEFSAENASSLSPILIICAIGMPFYAFVSIETRAFYSNKDTKTPVKGSTLALIVNIILSISLLRLLGRIEALVIASNTAIVVQAAYMHLRLCRLDLSLRLAEVLPSMLKYLVGCIVLAVVVCSLELALDDVRPSIRLAVSVPVGGAAYFIALRILKVREINAARHLFGSKGRSY